jgi:hypothetical protein
MYAKPQHRSAQRIGWREHTRSGQERPIGIRRQKDRRVPITPTPRPRASATPPSTGARYATCSSTVAIPWPTPMHIVARP